MATNNNKDFWRGIADRYFQATTSDDEERALQRFLASPYAGSEFDDVRAVMGLAVTGKRRYARRRRRRTAAGIAAAAAVVAAVFATSPFLHHSDNICVAYINGKEITDEAAVLAQMHSTMDEMARQSEDLAVDRQLSFFTNQRNND